MKQLHVWSLVYLPKQYDMFILQKTHYSSAPVCFIATYSRENNVILWNLATGFMDIKVEIFLDTISSCCTSSIANNRVSDSRDTSGLP